MKVKSNVGAERERAVIERQVQHLIGLVDDLLDVSRITRGKVDLRLAPVALADALTRSIEVASPVFEEHRHQLDVDVPQDLLVLADAGRIAQIISNLLTNAAKYTPPGGRVVVRGRRVGGHIELSVADTGIGIAEPMLETIFQPFIQTRQSIARSQGGLGLGLAIVSNLVELHGGTVRAKSEGRGRGSEFVVTLPALDTAMNEEQPPAPLDAPKAAGNGRVLVVDDNVDAAEMLRELLVTVGYNVTVAHDGPEALDVAETFRPQLGILDLGLPVMDGFELAHLLKSRTHLGSPKLVALTGYGQHEDVAKTSAAGFAAHLVKPLDFERLRTLMEELLAPP
jgi:CheY-like chemotaxis protein/two-component sensor histidine kinase